MSINPKLIDTISDATPLQKSPQSKFEPIANDSPDINRSSLMKRGSISIVSNVMSFNIIKEDFKPSQEPPTVRKGSSPSKFEEESKKSSGKIEISRMPYGIAVKNKNKESEEAL